MRRYTYEEAEALFIDKAKSIYKHYDKNPSQIYSSARMGGWLMKDEEDMIIGFVPNMGAIDVYNYVPQTSETIKEYQKPLGVIK